MAVLETANMHYVPSAEMHDFDRGRWYVAETDVGIVGVAGFRLIRHGDELVGKTTLLAVDPAARRHGIGRALQALRMELMRNAGAAARHAPWSAGGRGSSAARGRSESRVPRDR